MMVQSSHAQRPTLTFLIFVGVVAFQKEIFNDSSIVIFFSFSEKQLTQTIVKQQEWIQNGWIFGEYFARIPKHIPQLLLTLSNAVFMFSDNHRMSKNTKCFRNPKNTWKLIWFEQNSGIK